MFKFATSDTHDPEIRAMIGAPLREFNLRAIGPNHFRPLCIAIKDEHGNIVGACGGTLLVDGCTLNCWLCRRHHEALGLVRSS